jgi:hypothetical protein
MEPLESNRNKLAHLGRRSFCRLFATTVTLLVGRVSVGAACSTGDPAQPSNNPGPSPPVTANSSPFVCGRADCPVSIDAAGNMWCWCRTADIRDIRD